MQSLVCHAQQTHATVASARAHLDLVGDFEVITLRAIGVRDYSALRGGTFHLDTLLLTVASRSSSDVVEW